MKSPIRGNARSIVGRLHYVQLSLFENSTALSDDNAPVESSAKLIEKPKAAIFTDQRLKPMVPKPLEPPPPVVKWQPIPKWLSDVVCGNYTLAEKREAVEVALAEDDEFIEWALLELYSQCTLQEKANRTPKGVNERGFGLCSGETFMSMARYILANGNLTEKQVRLLRRTNEKGISKLGKHGEQLVALIAAAKCPERVSKTYSHLIEDDKEVA